MLIVQEDLRRTRPDSVPRLSPRGLARLTVLDYAWRRQRGSAEVEQEVHRSHHNSFAPGEAAVFVAGHHTLCSIAIRRNTRSG
jgi:hypothetical protein